MVERARPILRVGLTGGIASGKTTVGRMLAEHGAFVIDGDRIGHEVIGPGGSAFDAVVERFGREILDAGGCIDRARLGARVFHDDAERAALNAIVHPLIRAEADRRIAAYEGHATVAVFDAALLVESGAYRDFHRLIVIRCSRSSQIRRLLARDRLTTDEAEARIATQAPLEDKLAVADYVIDTDTTLRRTREQTDQLYVALLDDFERRFGPPTDD